MGCLYDGNGVRHELVWSDGSPLVLGVGGIRTVPWRQLLPFLLVQTRRVRNSCRMIRLHSGDPTDNDRPSSSARQLSPAPLVDFSQPLSQSSMAKVEDQVGLGSLSLKV